MKKSLVLTKEHIQLMKNMRFRQFDDARYGVDSYDLWGGSFIYEDMALLLGYMDKVIPETLDSPMGARYEDEYQDKMEILAGDFADHLADYEDILHQFCDRGGVLPGRYVSTSKHPLWVYEGPVEDTKE